MIRTAALLALLVCTPALAQTEITYQGSLTTNAQPYTGSADLAFSLWDAASGGSQVSTTVRIDDVAVAGGLLTCEVDFGVDPFGDATRWLEVSVRTPHDPTDLVPYDTLDPLQMLSRSPYALQTRGIYVDDDQNVGIGTTTPQHELHVEGLRPTLNIAATEDNVTAFPTLRFTGAPGPSVFQSLGSIAFHDDTGAFRASISANKSGPDAAHFNFVPADGAQSQLQIYEGLLRTYDMFEVRRSIDLELGAQIGVDGEHSLFQLQGGNVGIGTEFPGARLEVHGDGAQSYAIAGINDRGAGAGVYGLATSDEENVGFGVRGTAMGPNDYGIFGEAPNGFAGVFGSNDAIDGIGVFGRVTEYAGRGVEGYSDRTNGPSWGVVGKSDSNMGVGVEGVTTSTSGSTIGVVGKSMSSSGWDFFASGVGMGYGGSSSIRWKRNIEPLDDPLEKLSRVRGVTFDWDEEHGGRHDVGMIAEEVGAVLPEIVQFEENGIDAIGMDYSKMTPLLVEATKALRAEKDAEIESLRAEIHELRELVKSLAAAHEGDAK